MFAIIATAVSGKQCALSQINPIDYDKAY